MKIIKDVLVPLLIVALAAGLVMAVLYAIFLIGGTGGVEYEDEGAAGNIFEIVGAAAQPIFHLGAPAIATIWLRSEQGKTQINKLWKRIQERRL